jgi:beta-lactamase regulating signal transducer with metallopeptidase domain
MIPGLIEAALRALLVALTVWAGLRLLRVSNVLAQKAAWGLVLAAAVAMPLLMRWQILPAAISVRLPAPAPQQTSDLSLNQSVVVLSSRSSSTLSRPRLSTVPESMGATGDRFPAPSISNSEFDSPAQARSVHAQVATIQHDTSTSFNRIGGWATSLRHLRSGTVVGILYLAVLAGLLLRMAYGLAVAVRIWLTAEPVAASVGSELEAGLAEGLRLRSSRAVSSPVTIGSGVVLPADYAGWDAEKLRIVLAHERSHVHQGDFYLQMLAGVYAAAFWFSPLGWWLKRKLSDLGEAISDRAGLEEAASSTSYAQVLLEFAALPRPTAIGVAMARTSNLSHRIERLLNESSFRQAFAGSRRRVLHAILLVPMALFAGTALIRVEAAQAVPTPPAPAAAPSPAPNSAPAPAIAPSAPTPAADQAPAPVPEALAIAPSTDAIAPVPPAAPAAVPVPPVPPSPSEYGEIRDSADDRAAIIANSQDNTNTNTNSVTAKGRTSTSVGRGYSYSYSSNGDSWALITDQSEKVTFSGDWHDSTRDTIDKVRKMTNGKFLWFTHDGKSYFVDDPAIIEQIQAMYKPMEELGRKQEELGKQQEALGRQQEELGRKQEQASVPTPDISKEMAKLNEAVAKLDAKKGSTVSQEELADIEGKIGDIQGRLGELQGEVGEKQGQLGAEQGKLGAQQGKLGAEQGRLGAEQGRIASEADHKVKGIIGESLHNGKAKPVE